MLWSESGSGKQKYLSDDIFLKERVAFGGGGLKVVDSEQWLVICCCAWEASAD